MPKTKIVRKDAYTLTVSVWSPKKGSFRYILITFHLLMQKDLK